jgi:hypothetical protein
MGWDGMGWDGMGWDGMGWDGVLAGWALHWAQATRPPRVVYMPEILFL